MDLSGASASAGLVGSMSMASPPASPSTGQSQSYTSSRGFNLGNFMRRPRSGTATSASSTRDQHLLDQQQPSSPTTPTLPNNLSSSTTESNGNSTTGGNSSSSSRPGAMLRGLSSSTRGATANANPPSDSSSHQQQQQPQSPTSVNHHRAPGRSRSYSLSRVIPGMSANATTSSDSSSMAQFQPQQSQQAQQEDAGSSKPLHIRLVPHLELSARSLHFEPMSRLVKPGHSIRIGRYNERSVSHSTATKPNALECPRIAFKSKVVSRQHAELFLETAQDSSSQTLWVKDTKSSSGSFLNHIRLSGPGLESRQFQVRDGDVLQLGVDYQGGTEEMYRCVKMRVELNRHVQQGASQFNVKALKRALGTAGAGPSPAQPPVPSTSKNAPSTKPVPEQAPAGESTDCCICLFAVSVCQALFIAPCSHVYHYKCIRPLLQMHHPGFSCPLCRTFADLNADVETEEDWRLLEPNGHSDDTDEEDEAAANHTQQPELSTSQEPAAAAEEEEEGPATAALQGSFDEQVHNQPAANNNNNEDAAVSSPPSRQPSLRSRSYGSSSHLPSIDAGDFQADMRRSALSVQGPHGHSASLGQIAITGRNSRPGSIRHVDPSGATTPGSERRSLSHLPSMNEMRSDQDQQQAEAGLGAVTESLQNTHLAEAEAGEGAAEGGDEFSRVPTYVERRVNRLDVDEMERESAREAQLQHS